MSFHKPKMLVAALAAVSLASFAGGGVASAQVTAAPTVTEYYNGNTYTLSPGNWHGATNCAITAPTVANCFDTSTQMATFTTAQTEANAKAATATGASPQATGVCNGWDKIWNGPNFTNIGLAFEDYGYTQNLSNYVTVPFTIKSWFTDGQRGYNAMTNCWGYTWYPQFLNQTTNAQANNLGAGVPVTWILLSYGVD